MKNNKDKDIKIIAQRIVKLENELSLGRNTKKNQEEIKKIILSLPFEDVLLLDEYVQKILTN